MMELNLLPEHFEQARDAKRLPAAHCLIVVAVVCVIGIAEARRRLKARDIKSDLDTVSVSFSQANQDVQALSTFRSELSRWEADATLGIGLAFPFPRSRILADVARLTPDSVQLTSLTIAPDRPQATSSPAANQRPPHRAPVRAPKVKPAIVDQQLRAQLAAEAALGSQLTIQGKAKSISQVHMFVDRLRSLANVELDTARAIEDDFEFRIVAVISADLGESPSSDATDSLGDKP